jgi:hypothetical protein
MASFLIKGRKKEKDCSSEGKKKKINSDTFHYGKWKYLISMK